MGLNLFAPLKLILKLVRVLILVNLELTKSGQKGGQKGGWKGTMSLKKMIYYFKRIYDWNVCL